MPLRTRTTVAPPRVGLLVLWQIWFENLGARSNLRCVSFRRQISTLCSLRNWSRSSFLPRTPPRSQEQGFSRLSQAAQSYSAVKWITVEDNSRASFPCWEGGGRWEKTECQLCAGLCKKVLHEICYHLERWLTLRVGGKVFIQEACFELGGWDSTTDTSERAALHWPPARAACCSVHLIGWGGVGEAWALTMWPPRTIWFHPRPSLLRRWHRWSPFGRRQVRGDATLSTAFPLFSLFNNHLCFLPLAEPR
jgi:hypothetical protein